MKSKIEWTDKTWNPITGCTKYSSGCVNCYAEMMSRRLNAMGIKKYENEFSITLHEECLEEPFHWKGSNNVFVCSMSDLFHEAVPFDFIDKVMNTIKKTKNNRYQLLTKRAERMAEYFSIRSVPKNVWLGVTVEDESAKYRIDYLRYLKATIKFLSCEPLLSDLGKLDLQDIDWVIVGGESGSKARPMKEEWVLSIKEQTDKADIAFFFKQWGTWGSDGIKRNKKRNGRLLRGEIVQNTPILMKNTGIQFHYNSLKILGFKNIYENYSLVFELPLKDKTKIFVRSDCGCIDNEKYILMLDLNKIRESLEFKKILDDASLFKNPEIAPEYIRNRIKNCLAHFSNGIIAPVPLSRLSYLGDTVAVPSGITRLSYLVSVCDSSIPVECLKDSVENLFILFGDKNYVPQTLEEFRIEYENKMKASNLVDN